jgi:formylglycine-generating enzyme required for sulfatase activity
MKQVLLSLSALFMLSVFADSAVNASMVTVSSISVDSQENTLTVDYTLSDEAIITAQFFLDGEKIEEKFFANVIGDVNRLVSATAEGETRRILWPMDALWPRRTGSGTFSVQLSAYPKSSPPPYMVYDLVGSTNTSYSSVKFYTSTNALPGGIGDIAYRKEKMVFRRIPAADVVWIMGSPENELGRYDSSKDPNRETQHKVKLTSDYYMAVFEATQGQCKYIFSGVSGVNLPDNSLDGDNDPRYAQGNVAFYYLKKSETDEALDYMAIGKLRNRSLIQFDLPTEAQWEYACRAGTETSLNNNQNIDNTLTSARTRSLGWIFYRNATTYPDNPAEDGKPYGPRPVGLKIPNAWGLYDMHGNVAELCRDAAYRAYPTDDAVYENPMGTAYDSSRKRIRRGGYFSSGASDCRSAARAAEGNNVAHKGFGFRLIAPVVLDGGTGDRSEAETSAVVSTAQAVSYDTRWYSEAAATLLEMYRDFTGMMMIFR